MFLTSPATNSGPGLLEMATKESRWNDTQLQERNTVLQVVSSS